MEQIPSDDHTAPPGDDAKAFGESIQLLGFYSLLLYWFNAVVLAISFLICTLRIRRLAQVTNYQGHVLFTCRGGWTCSRDCSPASSGTHCAHCARWGQRCPGRDHTSNRGLNVLIYTELKIESWCSTAFWHPGVPRTRQCRVDEAYHLGYSVATWRKQETIV